MHSPPRLLDNFTFCDFGGHGDDDKQCQTCDDILEEWDTDYKEKKENEKRIGNLESKVDKLSEAISEFINEFKK